MNQANDAGFGKLPETKTEVSTGEPPVLRPGAVGGSKRKQPSAVLQYAKKSGKPREREPDLPIWALKLLKEGDVTERIISTAIANVRKKPGERTVREAQTILNEIGRSPRYTELVQSLVTDELLHWLLKRDSKKWRS